MKKRAVQAFTGLALILGFGLATLSPANSGSGNPPAGRLGAFVVHEAPKDAPAISFTTDSDETRNLDDWRGKAVLLNLWATWCAPCKHEMPQLDRLQAVLGGDSFEVVAVSLDRSGLKKPRRFYQRAKISHLALFNDKTMRLGATLGATGMPTTVLFDADGREVGRLTGPAEWDSPEAIAFIRDLAGLGDGS